MNNRVIALIDMDCFYCQVEVRLNPSLQNKPLAVVQYNTWKGGGIIAVNYEARDRGVTRHMRGDEAKSHCPDIELVHVPSVRGKADLTKYRDAGREVAAVLCENCKCVERASIDEAYLDLTEEIDELFLKEEFVSESQLANTFIVGYAQQGSNDECGRSEGLSRWLYDLKNEELDDVASKRLALGARIIEEIRASVYKKTGFRCSAGIAHNKIMAKVVCGLHKPNRQTVLPSSGVAELFSSLPVQKVRNLGGKFGSTVIDTLGCKVMADLARFSERELQSHFDEKTGTWLYNIARGIDLEPVTAKLMSKSIGCCKKFPGRSALSTRQDVMHWLSELSSEISDRLDEDYNLHKRRPLLLTASVQQMIDKKKVAMSKSSHISAYDMECIMQVALAAINKTNNAPSCSSAWQPPLLFLGISVRKFVKETSSSNKTISYFFKTATIEKCAPYSDHHTVTQQGSCTGSKELSHNVSRSASNPNSRPETGQNSSSNMKSKSVSFFERYLKTEKSENSSEAVEAFSDVMEKDNEEDSDCDIFDDSESSDVIGKLNGEVKSENNVMEVLTVKKDNSECDMFDGSIRNIGKENNLIEENMVECNGRVDLGSSKDERQINCSNNGGNAIGDMISDGETSWISPSEIFPDINNLDDSLVQLMPSPFIKKLKSYEMKMSKNNEGESNEEQCDNEGVKELDEGPSTSVAVDNINEFSDVDNLKSSYKVLENESNELDSYQETMIYPDVFKDTDREIKCDQRAVEAANKSGIYDFPVSRSEINIENEISELCPHCKESVRLSEFPEHLDHHIALDLHKSLNSSEVSQAPKKRILDSTESKPFKKKRGQPSTKEKITEKQKQTKSILSFFSRK